MDFHEFRKFLAKMELAKIWIGHCQVSLHIIPYNIPINKEFSLSTSAEYEKIEENVFLVKSKFELNAVGDSHEDKIVDITFLINTLYEVKIPFDDEIFEAFNTHILPAHTWPYAREFIHDMTLKMGLPSLTLPIWKAPNIQQLTIDDDNEREKRVVNKKTQTQEKSPAKKKTIAKKGTVKKKVTKKKTS